MGITCRSGQNLGFPRFCVHGYHHDLGPLRLGWLLAGPSASGKCVPTQRGARNNSLKEVSDARISTAPPKPMFQSWDPTLVWLLGWDPNWAEGVERKVGSAALFFFLIAFWFYRNSTDLHCVVSGTGTHGIHRHICKCQVFESFILIPVIKAFGLAFCWGPIFICIGFYSFLPTPNFRFWGGLFYFSHLLPLVSYVCFFKFPCVFLPVM